MTSKPGLKSRFGLLKLGSRFIFWLILDILIFGWTILIFAEGKLRFIFPLINPDEINPSSTLFPHNSCLIIFKSISSSISLPNKSLRVIADTLRFLSSFKLIFGLLKLIPGILPAILPLSSLSFGTLAFKIYWCAFIPGVGVLKSGGLSSRLLDGKLIFIPFILLSLFESDIIILSFFHNIGFIMFKFISSLISPENISFKVI